MYFQCEHEFDISLDALELAALSPALSDRFRLRLPRIDMLEQRSHVLENGELHRVWLFRPGLALPKPAARITKKFALSESWTIVENSHYSLRNHKKTWQLSFSRGEGHEDRSFGEGSYGLYPLGRGRSRRIATGTVSLGVPAVSRPLDAYVVSVLRSLYEAEAQSLRELVSLV